VNPKSELTLDHIVIGVSDLAQTITDYRRLGFTVVEGGRHPGRTSHNALVVFGDGAYLELIAWQAPAPEERWYRVRSEHGDGLVDFALLPDSTVTVLAAARARGLTTLNGPVDGGRLRPDGERLQWQTARHATPDLPFLCGDITPRSLRVPEGDVRMHANRALGVAALAVGVQDLDAALIRYRALLGSAAADAATPFVLPGTGLRLAVLPLAAARLVLMSPASAAPVAGESGVAAALRARLASRGEGPCALSLRVAPDCAGQTLDVVLTHGVVIDLLPVA
jgi:catechol 2,3-dioxygenase-like lactoylglutathione lyase family enzyme